MRQDDSRHWLRFQQFAPIFERNGKQEFEIFAIAEGVFQGGMIIPHLACHGTDGNRLREKDRSAVTLIADVFEIGGQAVADINHGMERDLLVE